MKKTELISKTRKSQGHIMSLLPLLQSGESFYTLAMPKVVTRYACMYGVKVQTERIILVHYSNDQEMKANKLTKVTII